LVKLHLENAWIRPFDVFEIKFLVQFKGVGGRALLLYKRFFSILTEKQ
jgi:hypothetical protein